VIVSQIRLGELLSLSPVLWSLLDVLSLFKPLCNSVKLSRHWCDRRNVGSVIFFFRCGLVARNSSCRKAPPRRFTPYAPITNRLSPPSRTQGRPLARYATRAARYRCIRASFVQSRPRIGRTTSRRRILGGGDGLYYGRWFTEQPQRFKNGRSKLSPVCFAGASQMKDTAQLAALRPTQ
jgi:hypothetical protein